MKSKLRLNASGISIKDLTPPFANTMLVAVFYSFGCFFLNKKYIAKMKVTM